MARSFRHAPATGTGGPLVDFYTNATKPLLSGLRTLPNNKLAISFVSAGLTDAVVKELTDFIRTHHTAIEQVEFHDTFHPDVSTSTFFLLLEALHASGLERFRGLPMSEGGECIPRAIRLHFLTHREPLDSRHIGLRFQRMTPEEEADVFSKAGVPPHGKSHVRLGVQRHLNEKNLEQIRTFVQLRRDDLRCVEFVDCIAPFPTNIDTRNRVSTAASTSPYAKAVFALLGDIARAPSIERFSDCNAVLEAAKRKRGDARAYFAILDSIMDKGHLRKLAIGAAAEGLTHVCEETLRVSLDERLSHVELDFFPHQEGAAKRAKRARKLARDGLRTRTLARCLRRYAGGARAELRTLTLSGCVLEDASDVQSFIRMMRLYANVDTLTLSNFRISREVNRSKSITSGVNLSKVLHNLRHLTLGRNILGESPLSMIDVLGLVVANERSLESFRMLYPSVRDIGDVRGVYDPRVSLREVLSTLDRCPNLTSVQLEDARTKRFRDTAFSYAMYGRFREKYIHSRLSADAQRHRENALISALLARDVGRGGYIDWMIWTLSDAQDRDER